MKVTREKVEDAQAYLSIELEPAEVEASLEKSYHRLVKRTRIPGFRKGKAPRAILERYIGRAGLLDEALNELVPETYQKAIKEQSIEAIAQPHIEITQTDPVVFKATVPLRPTVKLGDYQQIQVTPPSAKLAKDKVSAVMEQLRHQQATWEPAERPVQFTDLVVLDVESNVDGEPFINQKGVQYQVEPDVSVPVPGFAEQLPGMKIGGEKAFQLQLPSDYSRAELAGKEASFKVTVSEIKQEKLPPLDDELAKAVDPDCSTLGALREKVSTELKARAEEKARADFEEQVIQAVVDGAEVGFPPVLVEMEVARLFRESSQRLQMAGQGLEEYLNRINKTEVELREELRPLATKRVKVSLVLDKFAEAEKIVVGAAEIDAEVADMLKSAAGDKQDELREFMNTPQARQSIEQSLITRKTIERLMVIAKGATEAAKASVDKGEVKQ